MADTGSLNAMPQTCKKKPNVFIHIGHGKTGTTSIQDMFWLNRAEFFRHGILYPKVGVPERIHDVLQSGHHLLCNDLQVPFDHDQRSYINKIFSSLREEIDAVSPDVVFISSELLCYTAPEVPQLISTHFANFNVKIIYVVRRQDYLIPSAYLQAAKEGRSIAKCSLQEYLEAHSYAFDFCDRIRPWRDAFGSSSINSLLVKDGQRRDIREVILEMISCSLAPATLITGRENRTLGFGFLKLFRVLDSLDISDEIRCKILETLESVPGITASSNIPFDDIRFFCQKRFMQSNTEFAREYLNGAQAQYLSFDSHH